MAPRGLRKIVSLHRHYKIFPTKLYRLNTGESVKLKVWNDTCPRNFEIFTEGCSCVHPRDSDMPLDELLQEGRSKWMGLGSELSAISHQTRPEWRIDEA